MLSVSSTSAAIAIKLLLSAISSWLVDLYTVLLEYFAGEKPLRMNQISRKFAIYLLRSGKDCVYLLAII